MALPALRNVDGSPVQHEGQTLICLYDPEGIVEEQILLTPAAFFIASSLDGKADVSDIQVAFARQFRGTILPSDDIRSLVEALDERGFLLTERFYAIQKGVADAFAEAPTRKARAAGASYPADAAELRHYLGNLFAREKGPGQSLGDVGEGTPARGIVAPHIDFERGGHAYAHAYLSLYKRGQPRTALIFGVAHAPTPAPFILTRKDFETPFGQLKTDQSVVDRLARACRWDPFEHELVHRTEHSIEFQAVMLAYLYGTDVQIVPVLCGPFSEDPLMKDPGAIEDVSAFLDACREIAAPPDSAVTVIAGADLAHVGKRFGDPYDINDTVIRRVAHRDKEDLALVTALQPGPFYQSVMKDANERKVCGLGAIYATLRTVNGAAQYGELLCYDYAPDPLGGIVSFASIVLT